MALLNCMNSLFCSDCIRSSDMSTWDMPLRSILREAYAKGWITCKKSRYDGGDGIERAYCPDCASRHKENRFEYCV